MSAVAAVAAVAAPQAIRGALAAARFTWSETLALRPRWLVVYDRVDGLGSSVLENLGSALARFKTIWDSRFSGPAALAAKFFRKILKKGLQFSKGCGIILKLSSEAAN